MKIKYFLFILNISIILILTIFLYYIYSAQKEKLIDVTINNIKQDLLESKYIAKKYLDKKNTIINLRQLFDRKIAKNELIKGFILAKDNKVLVISGDVDLKIPSEDLVKHNISNITLNDLFDKKAFFIPIKLYEQSFQTYDIYIFLDQEKLKEILNDLKIQYILMYFVIISIIFVVFNFLIQKYIINPLMNIKEYAQQKKYEPKHIFIKELNEIKNALHISFKKLEDTIENLYQSSITDPLTRTGNKNFLRKEIQKLIEKNNEKFCVVFIDLDHFKEINDFFGHSIGDELIIQVSKSLKQFMKKDEILTRIGGDEFILVLRECDDIKKVEYRLYNLVNYLEQKWIIRNQEISTSASIGAVIYPDDGITFDELLKNSDIAMYEAKKRGRNQFVLFDKNVRDEINEVFIIKNKLQKAIENKEFELYYQPKVDKEGKVVACEALIRWNSDDGIVSPALFIPIAEKSGVIYEIGKWVIEEVMKTIKNWEKDKYLSNLSIAFNVSINQIKQEGFLHDLKNLLDIFKPDIRKLDMEITESIVIDNKERALHIFDLIHKLGFKINLDDFGTGYSSLSVLRDFKIDVLKIDKSFVDEILTDSGRVYVKTIIDMATNLHIKTVAEGVESKEQFEILKELGTNYYQGYYFSKPLKLKEFEKYARNNLKTNK